MWKTEKKREAETSVSRGCARLERGGVWVRVPWLLFLLSISMLSFRGHVLHICQAVLRPFTYGVKRLSTLFSKVVFCSVTSHRWGIRNLDAHDWPSPQPLEEAIWEREVRKS